MCAIFYSLTFLHHRGPWICDAYTHILLLHGPDVIILYKYITFIYYLRRLYEICVSCVMLYYITIFILLLTTVTIYRYAYYYYNSHRRQQDCCHNNVDSPIHTRDRFSHLYITYFIRIKRIRSTII